VPDSVLSRLAIPRRKANRLVDPLSLSVTCEHCHEMLGFFTREGVLFDWCFRCRREYRVPVRYADPEMSLKLDEARARFRALMGVRAEAA
jgi:hypothetical protein